MICTRQNIHQIELDAQKAFFFIKFKFSKRDWLFQNEEREIHSDT